MLHMEYITENRVNLHYDMPLNEVIYDFFDALKSEDERVRIGWITSSRGTSRQRWSSWIYCSTRRWWTRFP